jgi:hypothetical protein
VLTVGVTTLPRPKLARVLVFFGVLNLMQETDCIIWVKSTSLLHQEKLRLQIAAMQAELKALG